MRNTSAGAIAVSQSFSAQATGTISPQTSRVFVRKVPANPSAGVGMTLFLPANPSDEDSYTVENTDGSCSFGHILVVKPDPNDGTTVFGSPAGFPLLTPFSSATFTFEADGNLTTPTGPGNWVVSLDGTGAFIAGADIIGTGISFPPGNVSPSNLSLAANTPQILFAVQDTTKGGTTGRLDFALDFKLSASATLTLLIQTVKAVSGFSGGTLLNGSTSQLRYESGGAVSVTSSNSPTNFSHWAGKVASSTRTTATWAGLVSVTSDAGNDAPNAIIVSAQTDAAANLTDLSLSANWQAAVP